MLSEQQRADSDSCLDSDISHISNANTGVIFHDILSPACSLRRCEQTSLPMRAAARSLQLMSALACADSEKVHQPTSLSLSGFGFGFGFGLNARIFAVRRTWVRALAKHRRHSKVLRAARTKPHTYARTYAPAPAHPHTRCTRAISTQRRWHPHPRRPITFDLHPHVILISRGAAAH